MKKNSKKFCDVASPTFLKPEQTSKKRFACSASNLLSVFLAVAASFVGVRSSKHKKELNPIHLIFMGIFLACLFVFTLIFIVRFVIS